jgi:hypothetical protein
MAMELKERVRAFDVGAWWKLRETAPLSVASSRKDVQVSHAHLHNPYGGVSSAWQLGESLDDFFRRLPPDTTDMSSPDMQWIYVCNPFIPRKHKTEAQNQRSRGNEDEAPEEEGAKLFLAMDGAMERLYLLEDFIQGASKMGPDSASVVKDMNKERRVATQDILDLGHACKVRAGKVCHLPCRNRLQSK